MRTPSTAGDCGTGGGSSPTTLQAFEFDVDHTTDPDGFDITIPTPMTDGTYIPSLTLGPPTVDDVVDIFVLSRSGDGTTLRLGATAHFADGTKIFVVLNKATSPPF